MYKSILTLFFKLLQIFLKSREFRVQLFIVNRYFIQIKRYIPTPLPIIQIMYKKSPFIRYPIGICLPKIKSFIKYRYFKVSCLNKFIRWSWFYNIFLCIQIYAQPSDIRQTIFFCWLYYIFYSNQKIRFSFYCCSFKCIYIYYTYIFINIFYKFFYIYCFYKFFSFYIVQFY